MELSKLMGCVKRPFIPSELFRGGLIDGAWFDPSDLSTLYQDEAGTTPVTAVEQPVGLMLDKSRGMMLGPELISNGTFDSGIAGWEQKYNATTSYSLGSLKVMPAIINTNGAFAGQAIPTAIGRSYKVTFDLVTANAATYIRALNNINAPWVYTYGIAGAAVGNKSTLVFTATATVTYIAFGVSGSESLTNAAVYDNISVREIYGYHATQSITASRPTLSARYNLLNSTAGTLTLDANWNAVNVSGVLQPDGSSLITRTNTSSSAYAITTNALSAPIGTTLTATVRVKVASVGVLYGLRISGAYPNRADAVFNMQTGVVAFSSGSTYSAVSARISNEEEDGFREVSLTCKVAGSALYALVHGPAFNASASWEAASTTLLNCYAKTPSLVIGTTPGPYQRVNTTTDYDTDERYFPKYLRFDGVDDYLNLPYMGLYAGGSASVVAGIKSEDAAGVYSRILAETSSTLADPRYILLREDLNAPSIDINIVDDGGTSILDTGLVTLTNGESSIVSVVDSGSNLRAYKNAAMTLNNDYIRAGLVTLDSLTIGAQRAQSGAYNAFTKSALYGLIITKSALTDAQRVACERFEARKSGVLM